MSRTTTVDGAPASDTDKQSISQPNQFIKRGTPQFMRVTLALFSAGLATFALLLCATYPSGAFAGVWLNTREQ